MTKPQRAAALAVFAYLVADASESRAGCNLIPAAERTFPSNLGSVDGPLAAPDGEVEIRLHPDCDALSPGFDTTTAASNVVRITFEPPGGGPMTDVVVDAAAVTVQDPRTLRFAIPGTTSLHPPHGLAGPARIRVVHATSAVLLAEIRDLYQPTTGCDRFPDPVFQRFTILPRPNVMADIVAETASVIRATLDGGNNLLLPFDHVAVLPEGPNAPVARLLGGTSGIEAFSGGGVPITIPSQEFVRAFTLDGRPLPPLLRVGNAGTELFGTTDAETSVLRIARTDGGPPIYDFTDRLDGGVGPLLIDKNLDGFTITSREPVPLETLQSSEGVVAFARDETKEGNLNGDGDAFDRVVQIVDVATGASASTGRAVVTIADGNLQAPALIADGNLTAFLESESAQGDVDQNGDGDTDDAILRVFDGVGTELTAGFDVPAAVDRIINDREIGIAGDLVFFREPQPGIDFFAAADESVDPNNFGALDLAIPADGKHLYVTSSDRVLVLRFLPDGADVELLQQLVDGVGGVDGLHGYTLDGYLTLAVSPDGKHVYVASGSPSLGGYDQAVAVFSRDLASGLLTFVEAQFDGVGGVTGLNGAHDIAVSPDGAHVYVGTTWGDKVVAFARNPLTGALTFVGGFGTGFGFDTITLSPDGAHLYAANKFQSRLHVFARDAGTGVLTPVQTLQDGVDGIESLGTVTGLAVSPDGGHVYAGAFDPAITVFERDPSTGQLTFLDGALVGITSTADHIVVSPDGRRVYASGSQDGIAVCARDPDTGALTLLESESSGANFALTPDDRFLVGTGFLGATFLAWYRTDSARLKVFDTGTNTFRATPETNVRAVRLAEQYALLQSPEDAVGAQIVKLYDGAADTVTDFCTTIVHGSGFRIALSDSVVAWTAHESSGLGDENGDGDGVDRVLVTHTIGTSVLSCPIAAITADLVSVYDTTVVLTTLESSEGTDLNGDADEDDQVLRLYDVPGAAVTDLGAAEEFVRGGRLVAFRTSEAAEDFTDLNGDGDEVDTVMRVVDLDTGQVFETGQAAIRGAIGGCDPFVPYKVQGNVVAFLTREEDQGHSDLNGDGDAVDTVLQLFNVVGETLETFDLGDGCGGDTQLPRFPEILVDGTIQYVELSESERGEDLNGDGDTDDCVVFVTGDRDEDGTTDGGDTCVEEPNADQADADADVLGDVCDPSEQLPIDALALYGAKESAGTAKLAAFGPIVLGDRFTLLHDHVVKLAGLARPAVVNEVAVGDPDTSLVAYTVKRASGPAFQKLSGVRVRNACHDMLVEVVKPRTVMVPARTSLLGPVAPPIPGTHGVDHHQCYKVKVQSKLADGTALPKFLKGRQVTLDDELHTQPLRYDLVKPTTLCVPVAKAVDPDTPPAVLAGPAAGTPLVIDPAAITSPAQSLVCYRAKLAKTAIPQDDDGCEPLDGGIPQSLAQPKLAAVEGIHTADQFGALAVDAKKLVEICLPATTEVGGLPEAFVP